MSFNIGVEFIISEGVEMPKKKYEVEVHRIKFTPDLFVVEFKAVDPETRPKKYFVEERIDVIVKRLPEIVKEQNITFDHEKIKFMRHFDGICGDCSSMVYDPLANHWCRGSGLRINKEKKCSHTNHKSVRQFSEVIMYDLDYWKGLLS